MQTSPRQRHQAPAVLLALCAAVVGFAAQAAQVAAEPGAAERNRREVAACRDTATLENRAACLEDAMVAYREARRGALGDGVVVNAAELKANLLRRCDALKTAADKEDCLARMRGQGTTSGSIEGGGIYRELVTRTVGPVPAAPAAPAAPATEKAPEKTAP
jgi:hypothetical protein